MTDNQWAIVAIFLMLIGLFWYIKYFISYTTEWFGEDSFLNQEKSFEVKFVNILDSQTFSAIFAFFLFLYILSSTTITSQLITTLVPFLGIFFSIFILFVRWSFYKQSKDIIYHFEPANKSIKINGYKLNVIHFHEIKSINFYTLKSRLAFSFVVITLLNGENYLLNQELPCYRYLGVYFKGLKIYHHQIGYSLFFKWLRWMRSN